MNIYNRCWHSSSQAHMGVLETASKFLMLLLDLGIWIQEQKYCVRKTNLYISVRPFYFFYIYMCVCMYTYMYTHT